MKTVQDYPRQQVSYLQEFRTEILQADSVLSKVRRARTGVNERYDIPVVKLTLINDYPPVFLLDLLDTYGLDIVFTGYHDGELIVHVGLK